jgi:toxin ParE1/3/4
LKPHIFHPGATEEYISAVQYYADISPKLGHRFHLELERVIYEVCRIPERFFRFSPPAQRALARKFPYSLVYLNQPDRVWIVAVMHAKRRPGYWRERMS